MILILTRFRGGQSRHFWGGPVQRHSQGGGQLKKKSPCISKSVAASPLYNSQSIAASNVHSSSKSTAGSHAYNSNLTLASHLHSSCKSTVTYVHSSKSIAASHVRKLWQSFPNFSKFPKMSKNFTKISQNFSTRQYNS